MHCGCAPSVCTHQALRVCASLPPCFLRMQQGEDGGNATVGMEALRRVLLGYLNVSTPDCALGECEVL